MKLIIVESPHKSETIGKFLGSDYKVLASKGHICDLSVHGKMGLGVDVEHGFKPAYEISKEKQSVVTALKKALSKADDVYLATDPDREGEAISYHLARVLGLDIATTKRLEFHEITKSAVNKALASPRHIDMELVQSQETRRIIDRLMGFRLSTLLQKKIKSQSAGRVQSVVLKFIVDREKEIKEFIPVEYWTIQGTFFDNASLKIAADLSSYQGKSIAVHNEEEADKILSSLPHEFTVKNIKKNVVKKEPRPPFITSTLQQEAFIRYHFSAERTSAIAQKLYEGLDIGGQTTGLITYMRTDSIRLSNEFVSSCKDFIQNKFGSDYLGYAHVQKSNKNVQDAHEAIRPTDINLTPKAIKEFLTRDEYHLYSLIYQRAVASLMAAKKDEVTTLVFTGNDYDFTTSSTSTLFVGYTKIYEESEEKEEGETKKANAVSIPQNIQIGDVFTLDDVSKTQHFTKAPSRYNEGKIVKLMQENGIGRPSTYAKTISTLIDREYVKSVKGALIPTEQGELTVSKLEEYFPKYMDASYTAGMETSLDHIADGETDGLKLLTDFWDEFQKYYASAEEKMEKLQPKIVEGKICPICGSPLVYRKGKYGEFIGCSNYPKCTYIERQKEEPEKVVDHTCPKCGATLVWRKSKRGEFIGCSNYPKCDYMEDKDGNELTKKKTEIVIPKDAPLCPRCHTGHLIEKKSRWGKTFTGCSNYPKCRYIVPNDKTKKNNEDEE